MEMRAQACDARVAEHLELKKGDPVFVMERLVSDSTGRPMQSMTATFRADSFSYRIVSSSESEAGQEMRMEAAGLFS
jgi:GntR family transcriptional regulator